MGIDKDSLGCIWALLALPVVVALGLADVGGFRLWPTLAISFVVIDGALLGAVYLLDRAQTRADRVLHRMKDPVFGEVLLKKNGWEGDVVFRPTTSDVGLSIDSPESGPTEDQRRLFKQIEQRYNDLMPNIRKALVDYVNHDWKFELCDIEIPRNTESARWTAQYVADTEDDGDMGYFVDVVEWQVDGVSGVD